MGCGLACKGRTVDMAEEFGMSVAPHKPDYPRTERFL